MLPVWESYYQLLERRSEYSSISDSYYHELVPVLTSIFHQNFASVSITDSHDIVRMLHSLVQSQF
jgi:hypothetical protein